MIDALNISAAGLRSQQEQIDIISNNIANMQTPGFKKSRASFAEVSGVLDSSTGTDSSVHGGGSRIIASDADFSLGEFKPTQNATDIAIDGAGFLEIQNTDGEIRYTRSGQLRIDAEGNLSTTSGFKLSQNIQIPPDAVDLKIDSNGDVTVVIDGSMDRILIGSIELANFASPAALENLGDNTYAATDLSGAVITGRPGEDGLGKLRQGYLEMANVNMVEEMTNLVLAQRAYQLNARVLQASDQVLETINNLRR